MNGRLVAAAGLVLAAASFAGCIEGMTFLSSDETEVSAMANRDLADSAAQAWRPDAQLMAVFALEGTNATAPFPSDPTPGNGLAPMWMYAYMGDNGTEQRAFQVSADGLVRAMNESMGDMPSVGEPILNWQIDSDQAVSVAMGNETFAQVAGGEEAIVIEALGAEEGTLVWAVMAGNEAAQAIAIINAADGSVIMIEAFQMDFEMPDMPTWGMPGPTAAGPQIEMSESGTVSAGAPMEYEFSIAYEDSGMIAIAYSKTLPTDGLRWSIVSADDEDAEPVAAGTIREPAMSGGAGESFEIGPGDYRLVLSYASMVPLPVGSVDFDFDLIVGEMPEIEADS